MSEPAAGLAVVSEAPDVRRDVTGTGRQRRAASRVVRRIVALAVMLLLWQLASLAVGNDTLPGLPSMGQAIGNIAITGTFWLAVWDTVASTLLGLGLAIVLAVPLGIAIGSSRLATGSSQFLIDLLRTIPPVTLIPLALLLYGPTLPMKLLLIVYGAFWPLLVHSIYAIRDLDAVQRDVATVFRFRPRVRWLRVVLPAATPSILVGVRISATIALLLSVAAEQVAGQNNAAYVYVVAAALLGVLLNACTRRGERRLIAWHPSVRLAQAHR